MYAGDDVSSVVVDIGTHTTRLGYAGEDQPQSISSSNFGVIQDGSDRNGQVITSEPSIDFPRKLFDIQSIVNTDGFITDFDRFESYLEDKLSENLHLGIGDSPLLFTEPNEHNKDHRLKLAEIMFEKCNIPCMFICKNAVLSSFACGKSTCLVLDSGHNTTYAAPVFEGYILHNSTLKYNIGGKFINDRLVEYLQNKNIPLNPRYAFEKTTEGENTRVTLKEIDGITDSYRNYHVEKIIRLFKQEASLICELPIADKKMENIKHYEYELPDGYKVEIGGERCLFSEAFFSGIDVVNQELKKQGGDVQMYDEDPSLKNFMGVQHAITESINQADLDIRKELYSNILATGGNCMTQGFVNRLQKEIPDIAPQNLRVKVTSSHSGSVTEY
jgi:actin-like protein 6A